MVGDTLMVVQFSDSLEHSQAGATVEVGIVVMYGWGINRQVWMSDTY